MQRKNKEKMRGATEKLGQKLKFEGNVRSRNETEWKRNEETRNGNAKNRLKRKGIDKKRVKMRRKRLARSIYATEWHR